MSTIYRVTIVAEADGDYETLAEVAVPASVVVSTAGSVMIEVVNEHASRQRQVRPGIINVTAAPDLAGDEPETGEPDDSEPAPAPGEQAKPRRPRRTKAQMQAEREAEAARVAPEQQPADAAAGSAGALDTRTEDIVGPTAPEPAGDGDGDEPVTAPPAAPERFNPFA